MGTIRVEEGKDDYKLWTYAPERSVGRRMLTLLARGEHSDKGGEEAFASIKRTTQNGEEYKREEIKGWRIPRGSGRTALIYS